MTYDITFCSYQDCKNKKCERHQDRLKGYKYPVSVANFPDCEYFGSHEENKNGEN